MSTKIKSEWSHLPNAVHIDRVIASVKSHPEQWEVTQLPMQQEVWFKTFVAETSLGRDAVWRIAMDEAWREQQQFINQAAWDAVCVTLLCLVAYDDCAYMLDSEVGELKILATFGDPKAILMLPACIAFHSTKNIS